MGGSAAYTLGSAGHSCVFTSLRAALLESREYQCSCMYEHGRRGRCMGESEACDSAGMRFSDT